MMRNRRRHGGAVIEFALSFATLWAVSAGVFEFGYSMYIYNSLGSAVANAARYALRATFDDPSGATFTQEVRNMAVCGNPAGTGPALAPGLTPGHVAVTWARDAVGVPDTITVAITGYSLNALFRSYTLNRPRVTVRFLGRYTTPPT